MPTAETEALKKRADAAWRVADPWHAALREAYLWCAPGRYQAMVGGGNSADQQRPMCDHIFDPVGMQALEDGAAQIAEAIHPWDQPWARWAPRSDAEEENRGQVEEIGNKYTKVTESLLSRSNFHTAATAAHADFLCIGGFLQIEKDPEDQSRLRCTASPAHSWAVECDISGRTIAQFRKMLPKARTLDYLFGEQKVSYSDEARKVQKEEPERTVELMMAVYWSKKPDVLGKHWYSCVYETATLHEVWQTTHRACPVVFYKPSALPGIPWGWGPAMRALPDIKVANKVVERELRYATIACTGIYTAEDDGVLNPHNVILRPGAIIPIAAGSGGLKALEMPGRFDISQSKLEDLRVNIRRAFYVTRIEERDMTAQEYQGRLQQQIREMRGMYGQLRSEFAEGVMLRVLDLGEEMGAVERADLERLTQVLLVGPMAQDVAGAEVDRAMAAVGAIVGAAGPEVGMASLSLPRFITGVVAKKHAPEAWFRTELELKQLGQQVAQMAAQLMAQQMAGPQPPAGAPTAPNGAGVMQ